jgi:hypothetical protein
MERLRTMTNRGVRIVAGAAAAVVAVVTVGASPVLADPPPAAAGTTLHGFVAQGGVVTTIDHPDATTVPAVPAGGAGTATGGINDRGQILGDYEGQDRVVRHFVRDREGRYTQIEDPADGPDGTAFDEYLDINNRGEIVGFYNDEQGVTTTGFLRTTRGRFVDINVPGSQLTGPLKMNDRRQVVGIYVDADAEPNPVGTAPPGAVHGFLWDEGDFETIDVSGAVATLVTGINNRGDVVGSYIDTGGAYHGFVRDRRGVTSRPSRKPRAPTRPQEGRSRQASTSAARSSVSPTTRREDRAPSSTSAATSRCSTARPTRPTHGRSTSTTAARSSATTAPARPVSRPPRPR